MGMDVMKRATLPRHIGFEAGFDVEEITSENAKAVPNFYMLGETPGSFPTQNWVHSTMGASYRIPTSKVCVMSASSDSKLAKDLFPFGSALVGQSIKIDSIKYQVIGLLEKRGAMEGGNQDNFAVVPITTALNRYGSRWHSISIQVEAPSREAYEDTVDQVRSALRVVRKVPPGDEDDFEINSADSVLAQINAFTFAVRMAVSPRSVPSRWSPPASAS